MWALAGSPGQPRECARTWFHGGSFLSASEAISEHLRPANSSGNASQKHHGCVQMVGSGRLDRSLLAGANEGLDTARGVVLRRRFLERIALGGSATILTSISK